MWKSNAKWLVSVLIALVLVFGCSKDKGPTSPSSPYTGTWEGTWIPILTSEVTGSFKLTVQSDGSGTGSGTATYLNYQEQTVNQTISVAFDVSTEGAVTGDALWNGFVPQGSLRIDGRVIGELNSSNGTGSGTVRVNIEGTIYYIGWDVTLSNQD